MELFFRIRYDTAADNTDIWFNQKELTRNPYSPFAAIKDRPLTEWYTSLPEYCRQEAGSDSYTVEFEGPELWSELLRQVLGSRLCTVKQKGISAEHRLKWLKEIEAASGCAFTPSAIQYLAGSGVVIRNAGGRISLPCGVSVVLKETGTLSKADLIILQDDQEADYYEDLLERQNGSFKICIVLKSGSWQMTKAKENICRVVCGPDRLKYFLDEWYRDVYLAEDLKHYKACLSGGGSAVFCSSSLLKEKIRMLTDSRPYLELRLPSRIEVTDHTKQFEVRKLPEDMKCHVTTDTGNIAVITGDRFIHPAAEGTFILKVSPADDPSIQIERSAVIFRRYPVTAITLSLSNKNLVEGDTFKVFVSVSPKNADNLSSASFHISDPGCIEQLSSSRQEFKVKRAGTCDLTLTIGHVSKTIQVHSARRPTGLKIDKNKISLKLNDTTKSIHPQLIPAGARGGTFSYTVSNSVVKIDPVNGQILPQDEGTSVVTVYLVDPGGRRIAQEQCTVEVKPVRDVYTPDSRMVIAIVLLLLQLLFIHTPAAAAFSIAAIASAVYSFVKYDSTAVRAVDIIVIAVSIIMLCF